MEMQNAMAAVNARCRNLGYPEVEQGIGINTGETVVGNIGSEKRTKYGLVGKNVNLTGRIESYSVGGQILISESTAQACGPILEVRGTLEVMPKGVKNPITLFDIGGIGGSSRVSLQGEATVERVELKKGVPTEFFALEGKFATRKSYRGTISALSPKEALVQSETMPEKLCNLKVIVFSDDGREVTSELYAKVVEAPSDASSFKVVFTSIPPEAGVFFQGLLLQTAAIEK